MEHVHNWILKSTETVSLYADTLEKRESVYTYECQECEATESNQVIHIK